MTCREFNKTVLPRLIAERDEKLPSLRKDYATWVEDVRASLAKAEALVAAQSPYLPEYYHAHAEAIAAVVKTSEHYVRESFCL